VLDKRESVQESPGEEGLGSVKPARATKRFESLVDEMAVGSDRRKEEMAEVGENIADLQASLQETIQFKDSMKEAYETLRGAYEKVGLSYERRKPWIEEWFGFSSNGRTNKLFKPCRKRRPERI